MQDRKLIREEIFGQIRTLATAGFGFVAALAWNEAIQALLKSILPRPGSTLVGKFVYAIAVTAIVVVVTTRLSRFGKRSKQE